ncbi:hypothetical protein [Leptotrichia sp. oral taxon 879]|uniref:hypothetical protein n=1 Tax=Leptotrichia sp. oral taxon 879 TaxID=1227267 RepID=UPI0003ADAE68|nr:hypothetical protein [Leptotrichia sp. oral taxon 879]ERK48490.1 hypothetical protein HMPREF1552_02036 [Leptotrichia sp. oral taxon 879 str. F0557]
MKKILLGLFILGTLGMAESNYEVYVKNGVKISQSEVDRDSKEIENIVNKMINDYETRDKKIMLEKFRAITLRETKNDDDYKNFNAKDKEFYDKMNEIMVNEMMISLAKTTKYVPKSILFTSKNIAKVEITEIAPNFDNISNTDEDFDRAIKKAGVTDEEMNNLEHISDLSNQKKERFFKYLSEEIKKELSETTEENRSLEFKKVSGKWQTKDKLYDLPESD